MPPKSVVYQMLPTFADAKHVLALGQLTPASTGLPGGLSVRQLVPPSDVVAIRPPAPVA